VPLHAKQEICIRYRDNTYILFVCFFLAGWGWNAGRDLVTNNDVLGYFSTVLRGCGGCVPEGFPS
jgi:hypothetical protein